MSRPNEPFDSRYLERVLGDQLDARRLWVGFSGGADSTALLHALLNVRNQRRLEIAAVHVNHGLHPDAGRWEQSCIAWCEERDVPLETRQLEISGDTGKGIEAEARHQRYQAVEALLGENEIFLTAHHRDDQAETLLLNLLRSSGVDGLAGMPRQRALGQGLLLRPLLDVPRASLLTYLRAHGLDWIEDPSNQRLCQDRNYLRHTVLPLLEKRWPSTHARLARSAQNCRQAATALRQLADEHLATLLKHDRLMTLPAGNQPVKLGLALLIRQWLKRNGLSSPPAARLEEFCRQLEEAGTGSEVAMVWADGLIRQYDGQLWLDWKQLSPETVEKSWRGDEPLELNESSGKIAFSAPPRLENASLHVSFRRGGERIQAAQDGSHKSVKNLLRELRFPPWQRAEVPLVFENSKLVAVADLCLENAFRRQLERQSIQLHWAPGDALMEHVHNRALQGLVDPPNRLG